MATWNPDNVILTQKGEELLSKVQLGIGKISVSRVVTGGEFVPYAHLSRQTEIPSIKQELSIVGSTTNEMGSELSLSITNEKLTEEYDLFTIGIYVTHPDYEGEVLYTIAECDQDTADHIPLPSVTIATLSYGIFMEHSGTTNIEITLSPEGVLTTGDLNIPGGVPTLDRNGILDPSVIPDMTGDCTYFGTCETDVGVITKVITVPDPSYRQVDGARIAVLFTKGFYNTRTPSSVKLNVNGIGELPIAGFDSPSTLKLDKVNCIVSFIYKGSKFIVDSLEVVTGNSTQPGVLKISDEIGTAHDVAFSQAAAKKLKEDLEIALGTADDYFCGDKTWKSLSKAIRGVLLTGLTNGSNTAILATDTLLAALAKLQAQINSKQGTITAGTSAQYFRGDKSWQALDAAVRAVVLAGLSTGNNSAILATDSVIVAMGKLQAQINAKQGNIPTGTTSQYYRGDKSWQDFATAVRAAVLTGLSTSNSNAVVASDTVLVAIGKLQAQVNGKQNTIATGSTAQYYRGDKTWQNFASAVRASVLSGLSISNSIITASDTVLSALGKLQGQISANSGVVAGTYNVIQTCLMFRSNNQKMTNTTATTTLTAKSAGTISFSYQNSGESSCDYLTVLLNGTTIVNCSGKPEYWGDYSGGQISANQTLVFNFRKDGSVDSGKDCGTVFALRFNGVLITASNLSTYFTVSNNSYYFTQKTVDVLAKLSETVDARGRVTGITVGGYYLNGEVTLSDEYNVTNKKAADGWAASPYAVYQAYNLANTANNTANSKSKCTVYNVTIPTGSWTSNSTTGYYKTVNVSGLQSTHSCTIGPVFSSTSKTTNQSILDNWAKVSRIVVNTGSITIYCFDEVPSIALPIQIQALTH